MPVEDLDVEVTGDAAGRALASIIKQAVGISHSAARGLLDARLVRVNGRIVTDPGFRPREGDRIHARIDPSRRYRPSPAPRRQAGFEPVLEDPHMIVVEKEPGVLSVPTPTQTGDSLVDRLLAMYASKGVRSPRLWVVHRLDRFTSGLVMFARTESAAASLLGQFRRRSARREYLALCEGVPVPRSGRMAGRIGRHPKSLKMTIERRPGKGVVAELDYHVEEEFSGSALVRIVLRTGRRNQIRVQFTAAGHPLLGDHSYGRPSDLIDRVALHATLLGFEHPATGKPIVLESRLPGDISRALRALRRPA